MAAELGWLPRDTNSHQKGKKESRSLSHVRTLGMHSAHSEGGGILHGGNRARTSGPPGSYLRIYTSGTPGSATHATPCLCRDLEFLEQAGSFQQPQVSRGASGAAGGQVAPVRDRGQGTGGRHIVPEGAFLRSIHLHSCN